MHKIKERNEAARRTRQDPTPHVWYHTRRVTCTGPTRSLLSMTSNKIECALSKHHPVKGREGKGEERGGGRQASNFFCQRRRTNTRDALFLGGGGARKKGAKRLGCGGGGVVFSCFFCFFLFCFCLNEIINLNLARVKVRRRRNGRVRAHRLLRLRVLEAVQVRRRRRDLPARTADGPTVRRRLRGPPVAGRVHLGRVDHPRRVAVHRRDGLPRLEHRVKRVGPRRLLPAVHQVRVEGASAPPAVRLVVVVVVVVVERVHGLRLPLAVVRRVLRRVVRARRLLRGVRAVGAAARLLPHAQLPVRQGQPERHAAEEDEHKRDDGHDPQRAQAAAVVRGAAGLLHGRRVRHGAVGGHGGGDDAAGRVGGDGDGAGRAGVAQDERESRLARLHPPRHAGTGALLRVDAERGRERARDGGRAVLLLQRRRHEAGVEHVHVAVCVDGLHVDDERRVLRRRLPAAQRCAQRLRRRRDLEGTHRQLREAARCVRDL
eukprot:Rhum_TRINITY_DN14737_c6_g2::Rhum_TRINITY_DN14737_c6_g2_i1::g.113614::m.113614